LAALARWHQDQGFPDPTKAPVVKQVLKGIRAVHPNQEKQANPLQISDLEKIVIYLDKHIRQTSQRSELLPLYRNKALLLLGCGSVLIARKINCILLSESLAELSEHYFC